MSLEECFACLKKKLEDSKVPLLSNHFKSLSTDLERVQFLLNLDDSTKCVSIANVPITVKSTEKSKELRSSGNIFFKNGDFITAISNYTKSICYAPREDDDNCLSLALGNRSAVLFRLRKYSEALEDISLAMKHNYPPSLLPKLLERKGDCLRGISCSIQAKDCYKQALEQCSPQDLKFIKNINEKLHSPVHPVRPEIGTRTTFTEAMPTFQEGSNLKYPSLSSSCTVSYSISKGRHIIADRNIMPGETILVEKPFASILIPQRYLKHCHFCFKCTINPLPCNSCVYSVFCSDKCRYDANQSFHRHECSIMDILDACGIDKFSRLAIRTVLSLPISEICDHVFSAHTSDAFAEHEGKMYTWNDYNAICSLLTNDTKRPISDLFRRAFVAIYLLKIIEMSSYLKNVNSCVNANVAALLLSHLQSFPCNAHEISEFLVRESDVENAEARELGAGIYATLSLFNHSCNPNVNRNFYGDVCVVRSISKIEKGSEITDNYGTIFQLYSNVEREQYLNPQYYFKCECLACLESWPTFGNSFKMPIIWKCTECTHKLETCLADVVTCNRCKAIQKVSEKKLRVEKNKDLFESAYNLLMLGKPKEAIPGICTYIKVLNEEVCEPSNELSRCQESLKQCLGLMANCCTSELLN